jgi:hypothetical protein
LHYGKPLHRFERTSFTLDEFVLNGVNLAQYGLEDDHHFSGNYLSEPYQLFDNFDIGDLIHGSGNLVGLGSLSQRSGTPKSHLLHGQSCPETMDGSQGLSHASLCGLELPARIRSHTHRSRKRQKLEEKVVSNLLPAQKSYVVKPAHKSCSSGVWLVRYDQHTHQQSMEYSGHPTAHPFDEQRTTQRIVQDLHEKAVDMESWALKNVPPGFVVEERYSAPDSDTNAAYEFKTFTVWGKVYFGYLKPGSGDYLGLVYRNGTMITQFQHHNVDWTTVPDWLQWDKVVELAEELAQHKDMFRADMFVGLPSGSHELYRATTQAEDVLSSMHLAISETEFVDGRIQNENLQVSKEFLKNGYYLSEADAANLQLF